MNTLIVFVKAPVPGKVKTRLCPPLSHAQAAALYRAFAADTLRLCAEIPRTDVDTADDLLALKARKPAAGPWRRTREVLESL